MSKENGKIEQGDVVFLKSGSPEMTVVSVNDLVASITRFDEDNTKVTDTYPTVMLTHENNGEWIKQQMHRGRL